VNACETVLRYLQGETTTPEHHIYRTSVVLNETPRTRDYHKATKNEEKLGLKTTPLRVFRVITEEQRENVNRIISGMLYGEEEEPYLEECPETEEAQAAVDYDIPNFEIDIDLSEEEKEDEDIIQVEDFVDSTAPAYTENKTDGVGNEAWERDTSLVEVFQERVQREQEIGSSDSPPSPIRWDLPSPPSTNTSHSQKAEAQDVKTFQKNAVSGEAGEESKTQECRLFGSESGI
jgi:hypothetical protein